MFTWLKKLFLKEVDQSFINQNEFNTNLVEVINNLTARVEHLETHIHTHPEIESPLPGELPLDKGN